MCRSLLALLCVFATTAFGWELKPQVSSLSVDVAGQTFRFGALQGTLDSAGVALLSIPLNSIDTGVPERDEKVRDLLFDVDKFPKANFLATVDLSQVTGLKVGEELRLPMKGRLTLHGKVGEAGGDTVVTMLADGNLKIASAAPVIVNTADFDMAKGMSRLMRAGDVTLEPAVPVSFTLVFAP